MRKMVFCSYVFYHRYMRIFHILPHNTSIEEDQNFLALAGSFKTLGFKQAVATRQDEPLLTALEAMDIPVSVQKFGGMFDLRTKKTIQAEILDFKPHIVQGHGITSLDFEKDIPPHIPYIPLIGHDPDIDGVQLRKNHPYAILTGYCSSGKTQKSDNLPPVLPPLPMPRTMPETGNAPADMPALPENAFAAGYGGSLTEDLMLDHVFQAIREIPALHLVLVESGPNQQYFKDMARKRGIHDRVHFIPPPESPHDFYKALDLCIVPAQKHDPLRAILDAWQAETPVLLVGHNRPAPVTDDETGWIVPDGDVMVLRRTLNAIINNPDSSRKKALSGKAVFDKHFTHQNILGRYLTLYKDILSS